MSSQGQTQDLPFKPGTIRKIKLNNFMCHENFELPFGSSVNFIIGPNGSGKSAILTGLVIALGGRATTTSRAKKMSEFIKYGKTQAKITVVLHNYEKVMEKSLAFKPDDYGKFIIIEKYIYKDEASKLALKNDRDKKVSERKQELDEMLEHFNILINNPICILNQEVSKTFLHSKRPEDKFDLFMKATNLEQIEQDYESAESSHKEWEGCNTRNTFAFKQLDKEYGACREKTSFLENRAKIYELRNELNEEYIWAVVRDNEKISVELSKRIQNINKTIEEAKKNIEEKEIKLQTYLEDLQTMKDKISSSNERLDMAKSKFQVVRLEETKVKSKMVDHKSEIDRIQRKIGKYTEDRANLTKSIDSIKQQMKDQNELNNDVEQRKLDIEELEKEVVSEQAREKSIRLHSHQLNESMTAIRSDLYSSNMRVNELKYKLSTINASLRRIKNGQENAIRKYGDYVIKIREEIDRAFNQNRFKKKPIGPLGYHLKLRSQEIAAPLEVHLGRTAHAFVCDNHQDMNVLTGIFRKIASTTPDFRYPILITRPFTKKHDVSRFTARHDVYKTFLDYLEIQEDPIYNVVVDRNSLEAVLFIPDYHEAESLMIDSRSVPKNTRMAYTKDCSVMHPRNSKGGYRSFANTQTLQSLFADSNTSAIKELEREMQLIEADLRDAEHIVRRNQDSLNVQRKEYDENQIELKKLMINIRKKEDKLLELKTMMGAEEAPQELSALEMELESIAKLIAEEEIKKEKAKEKVEMLERDLKGILKEKSACQELIDTHDKERLTVSNIIESTKSNQVATETAIRQCKSQIDSRVKEKDETEQKQEKILELIAKSKQNLTEDSRPTGIRATEFLKEELRKIEAQLRVEQEEMQDPEEMMESLKKRMREIENLTSLKDSNLLNFSLAAKTLDQRKEGLVSLRSNTIGSVSAVFTSMMRPMGMNGQLQIYLDDMIVRGEVVKKGKTLEMRIDTNYNPSQRVMSDANNSQANRRVSRSQPSTEPSLGPPRAKRSRGLDENGNPRDSAANEKENENEEIKMTDARSLSGGERSFSTVAFVLALWHHCASPFKLMDEIDVFMDMVTRRVSYNALIRFAQVDENSGQFIFFSPLELPKIDSSGSVRVFEMPAIIRKRPLSQMAGGDAG